MSTGLQNKSAVEVTVDDPERPAYAADGTDLSLIRWMLRKTPTERILTLQSHVNATLTVWRELGKR